MAVQESNEYLVTSVIVVYKTDPTELGGAIRSCLESSTRVRVLVVDNSPDDELSALCSALGAEYTHTHKNLGYGAAHNIGFNIAPPSKYHLILNPDVVFGPYTLEKLVAFLDANESVGLVMPHVQYPDGSGQNLCKRLPTPFNIFMRRVFPRSLQHLFQRSIDRFETADVVRDRPLSIPCLSGCFMLLRKTALDEVGLFDERFFMYFEDFDLSRRIRQKYQTVYYPDVTITHRHERGSFKSKKLLLHGICSAIKYFNKWGWVVDGERKRLNHLVGPFSTPPSLDTFMPTTTNCSIQANRAGMGQYDESSETR
jgi:GT2 family glycosyltransferase